MPLWTRDGSQVTFSSNDGLWNIAADFSEEPQLLAAASFGGGDSWSPNGRVLLWSDPANVNQLTLLEDGEVEHASILAEVYDEEDASFSADGSWFAYATDEIGSEEVYVEPYAVGSGQKQRITQGGGQDPVWSRSGRELFYMDDGQLNRTGFLGDRIR